MCSLLAILFNKDMFHFQSHLFFIHLLILIAGTPIQAQSVSSKLTDTIVPKNQNSNRSNTLSFLGINGINTFNENILSLFEDREKNFWIGTDGNGVFRYDSNKILSHFTERDGLSNNQILTIQQDIYNNIWFSTGGFKITVFDGVKFNDVTKGDQIMIQKKWTAENKDLFFPGGSGLFRYSPLQNTRTEKFRLVYMPFPEYMQTNFSNLPVSPGRLTSFGVYSLITDQHGHLWIGTQNKGVAYFNRDSIFWLKEKNLAGPAVLALFEDNAGTLWSGNNGAGLFHYKNNGLHKNLTNFTDEKGLGNSNFLVTGKPKENSLARIYSINQDKSGNLWVGTVDSGVWKFNPQTGTLNNYTIRHGLPSNAVTVIYKDTNDELWFGTTRGLCKFDGLHFQPIRFN